MFQRTLTLGLILALTTVGAALADDAQPADAPTLDPATSTVQADSSCEKAAVETEANASEANATLSTFSQDSAMVRVTSGGFCEPWEYVGCCPGNLKKTSRVCFDASGNRTTETKCSGFCPG